MGICTMKLFRSPWRTYWRKAQVANRRLRNSTLCSCWRSGRPWTWLSPLPSRTSSSLQGQTSPRFLLIKTHFFIRQYITTWNTSHISCNSQNRDLSRLNPIYRFALPIYLCVAKVESFSTEVHQRICIQIFSVVFIFTDVFFRNFGL